MTKFINTNATNYHLENLIKDASDRLILISPFLKLNDRIKDLLEDKNRLKIDVRIVYGKSELQPEEVNWLKELEFIRTSFCRNLHAKCYLSEKACIITSMNLYEFSQVNNYEMGLLISRDEDSDIYKAAHQEAQSIIRISDEVKISFEKVEKDEATEVHNEQTKLSSSKIAKKLNLKSTAELLEKFTEAGLLKRSGDQYMLTEKGISLGGEEKSSKRFGDYFVWPDNIAL